MAEPPEEIVDELYAAPVDEFIARRDARAKELRGAGDRAAADAVKKLRRPSVSAAAVNRLARDAPDDVSSLLAAGEALRQAQLGGGDRDAIRSAASEEREAVERLVGEAAAFGVSPAAQEEVRGTLHAAAMDDEVREAIRRGVLTEARQAVGLGGLGAAVSRPARSGVARSGAARRGAARPGAVRPGGGGEGGSKPAGRGGTRSAGEGGTKAGTKAGAKGAGEAERKRAAEAER
ncbi:MAG: hypothetical protein QOJ57_969 [Thermoleophilaceae bacterium]|nr:hypothetical protein [Thermoleophilaceae bacterium]